MKQRSVVRFGLGLLLGVIWQLALAAEVSTPDAVSGLKTTLLKGSDAAIATLGRPDGFMGNERVRIPLPENLRRGESLARKLGMGAQIDELIAAMNHAAEAAVVEAKPLLVNAVKNISFSDARGILVGADDAATQYFRRTTATPMGEKFRPIVKRMTSKTELAGKYNQYAGKAAQLGLIDKSDADLDGYVTGKALDAVFLMIADQEKAIRHDPIGTGSALLKRVFANPAN